MNTSKKILRSIPILIGICLFLSTGVTSSQANTNFTDVLKTDIHLENIRKAVSLGYIKGFPNGTFLPYGNITRGQLVKILSRINAPNNTNGITPYVDVPSTFTDRELYNASINVKSHNGYDVFGKNGVNFLFPSQEILREEMAMILVKLLELNDTGEEVVIKDLQKADSDYRLAIKILMQNGITIVPDGNFRPKEKVKRAQFATFLIRSISSTLPIENVVSVQVSTGSINKLITDPRLSFKINGESTNASIKQLEDSGYTIQFSATRGVFQNNDPFTSSTGILKNSGLPNTFEYMVTVLRDGKVIAKSNISKITTTETVESNDKITSYILRNVTNNANSIVKSNTLVLSENYKITNIIGDLTNGPKNSSIPYGSVIFTSSNKNVALISTNGDIYPINPGVTSITMRLGAFTQSITLTVKNEKRIPKTISLDKTSIKVMKDGAQALVVAVVKDQFNDPLPGVTFDSNDTSGKLKFNYAISNVLGGNVARVNGTTIIGVTDSSGKAFFSIQGLNPGNGTVKVRYGATVLGTINVSTSADTLVASRKIELLNPQKDLVLDVLKLKGDSQLNLVYAKYNSSGFSLGNETSMREDNTLQFNAILEANGTDTSVDVDATGTITVNAGTKAGNVVLVIREGAVERERLAIKIVDSTPTITSVSPKLVSKITTVGDFSVDKLLYFNGPPNNPLTDIELQGIGVTQDYGRKLRIDQLTGTLYLDDNIPSASNASIGKLDSSNNSLDVVVGKVTIINTMSIPKPPGTTISLTNGNKGSIAYVFKNNKGEIISTVVIDVDLQ